MRASRVGSFEDRFHSRYEVDPSTGCWNWSGGKNSKGYGVIGGVVLNGKRYTPKEVGMLAHRASWLLHFGDIPVGEGAHGTVVMHKCDNPACVNPNHLRLGTQADNVRDMIEKGRKVAGAWQTAKGIHHFRSVIKNQADIDMICSTVGKTSELAARFGVDRCTIKRIRRRNMPASGSTETERASCPSI